MTECESLNFKVLKFTWVNHKTLYSTPKIGYRIYPFSPFDYMLNIVKTRLNKFQLLLLLNNAYSTLFDLFKIVESFKNCRTVKAFIFS